MSASILFDAPGPRTRARHRLYSILTVVGILAVVALALRQLSTNGQLDGELWEPFVTPRYISALLVDGLLVTLRMAFFSIIFAVIFGVVFGVAKLAETPLVRRPAWAVVEFFRAVPVLLLMITFFAIVNQKYEFWCVVVALTLYNGAVLAEVIRAGILAVPAGQAEAAAALGMSKGQITSIVMLPQAVKIMIPSIISQAIVTLKDTSLGAAIAAPGLTAIGGRIQGQFGNFVPTTFVLIATYVLVNLILAGIATYAQKRYVGIQDARPTPGAGMTDVDTGRAV